MHAANSTVGGLVEPPLQLPQGWVITPHINICTWLLIHTLIAVNLSMTVVWRLSLWLVHRTIASVAVKEIMMTSSNGNIFRVTGPLCWEFTGPGEFPAQRPVTRSFDVFFDLRPNKRLSRQPWGWWFERRHRGDYDVIVMFWNMAKLTDAIHNITQQVINLLTWISNHMQSKMYDDITYPQLKLFCDPFRFKR